MSRPSFMAAASVAGEVLAPSTTSKVFMTLAGTKKCVPATASGRLVTLAISSMSRAEVLVSSSAPGFIDRIEPGEHLLLDGHLLEHRLDHGVAIGDRLVGLDRLDQGRRSSISSWVRLPRLTLTA